MTPGYYIPTVLLEYTSHRVQVTADCGEFVHCGPECRKLAVR